MQNQLNLYFVMKQREYTKQIRQEAFFKNLGKRKKAMNTKMQPSSAAHNHVEMIIEEFIDLKEVSESMFIKLSDECLDNAGRKDVQV